eukprot:3530-Heterococcus_DN1.PRE.8
MAAAAPESVVAELPDADDDIRPPCRFHLLGTCKFGTACTYSHAAGIGVGDKRPLCPYIDKPGGCRHGASCFLRHPQSETELAAAAALALAEQQQQQQEAAAAAVVVEDVEIGLVVYGPNGEAHRQVPKQTAVRSKLSAHAPEFKFTPAAAAPIATVVSEAVTEESTAVAAAVVEPKAQAKEKADAEQCGICFDSIAACGKRFGLLTGCDHVFCLECIRTWRKSTSVEKDVSRSCPCCREHSYFVMPSKFSVTGESKVQAIAKYKECLSKRPCALFKPDNPAHSCPFGAKCHYAHTAADGVTDLKAASEFPHSSRFSSSVKPSSRTGPFGSTSVSRRQQRWHAHHPHHHGYGSGSMPYERLIESLHHDELLRLSELFEQIIMLEGDDFLLSISIVAHVGAGQRSKAPAAIASCCDDCYLHQRGFARVNVSSKAPHMRNGALQTATTKLHCKVRDSHNRLRETTTGTEQSLVDKLP